MDRGDDSPRVICGSKEAKEARNEIIKAELLQGKTGTEALIAAGYSEGTARGNVSKYIKPLREEIMEEIRARGCDSKMLIDRLMEGLDSNKLYVFKDGSTIENPDMRTRLEYIRELLKLADAYPAERQELVVETYEQKVMRIYNESRER